jgi:hypothetical protein
MPSNPTAPCTCFAHAEVMNSNWSEEPMLKNQQIEKNPMLTNQFRVEEWAN